MTGPFSGCVWGLFSKLWCAIEHKSCVCVSVVCYGAYNRVLGTDLANLTAIKDKRGFSLRGPPAPHGVVPHLALTWTGRTTGLSNLEIPNFRSQVKMAINYIRHSIRLECNECHLPQQENLESERIVHEAVLTPRSVS